MLEVDRTFEALNHGTGWPHGRPRAVLIHATRGGQPNRQSLAGHRLETESTINWFKSQASQASTNLIVSPVEIVRMVSDEDYAWHAREHSSRAYSIELTQSLPTDPYLDGHYELLARTGRHYVSLGVPPVYLPHYSNGMEGFTGHEDSEQGVRDGKSDPGGNFDWPRFIAMIQEPQESDEMTFIGVGHDKAKTGTEFESFRLYVDASGLRREKIDTKQEREALDAAGFPLMKMTRAQLEQYAL